jgi:hypothetical protein
MFALAADGVNFWEERDGGGTQQPRSLKLLQGRSQKGLKGAGLQQQIDWLAPPDGRRLLRERRTIEVFASAEPAATILLWRSRLEVADRQPQVVLGGSHYVGLGVRFLASMDRGGRFFNADKKEGDSIRNTERLTQTHWCAYTAEANGRPVTLAFFDHPGNVRHPSRMFTMTSPFAYLAATLNLWKEPLSMASGDALELVYSVVVLDGEASWETIEALYHRWCK